MKTPSDLHAMLTKEEHGTNAPAVHRAVTKSSSYSYKSSSSYKKQQHQIVQHCRKSKYVSSGRPCSTTTSLSGAFVSRPGSTVEKASMSLQAGRAALLLARQELS